ncbi:MAG: hypothetical protein ACR2JW_13750 [Thermomicrobiales bacterium]
MQRVRLVVTLAVLSIGLFVATNPVFAAAGGNGNGNGGCGNGNGNGNKCDPGAPVLPEAPMAIWLLGAGVVVAIVACLIVSLRRRSMRMPVAE